MNVKVDLAQLGRVWLTIIYILYGVILGVLVLSMLRTIIVVTDMEDNVNSLMKNQKQVLKIKRQRTWIQRIDQWLGDKRK